MKPSSQSAALDLVMCWFVFVFKSLQASQELLEKHYGDLSAKPFFPGLCKFMSTGPVCAMVGGANVGQQNVMIVCTCVFQVWEGLGAVATGRQMLGETDPVRSHI